MKPVLSRALTLVLAILAVAANAAAQDSKPTSAQLTTARELLVAMDVEAAMVASFEATVDAQFAQNPLMSSAREPMVAWARKYMTMEYMGDQLATVYAEEFTAAELEELLAFYRAPLGVKLAERTPVLARKGAMIGAEIAQRYTGELQRMVQEHLAGDSAATTPQH